MNALLHFKPIFAFAVCFALLCIWDSNLKAQASLKLYHQGSSSVGNFMYDANAVLTKATFSINTKPESSSGELTILDGQIDITGIARVPNSKLPSSGINSTLIDWGTTDIIGHKNNPNKNLTLSQLKSNYPGFISRYDSLISKFNLEMDYRFRVEQDWNSLKSDGNFRKNRSRLRYRFRVGSTFKNDWYSIGFRIRTGDPKKQQDPQLTLGKGFKEFGTLPIGFEKIFMEANWKNFKIWFGKNTFPFEKNNELFWSDNVFPEGISILKGFKIKSSLIDEIKLIGGHFVLGSNDDSFNNDAHLTGLQTSISTANNIFNFSPTLYIFRNIPNIPDGNHSFLINYTILHLGTRTHLFKNKSISLEFDYYINIENYDQSNDIPQNLKTQKHGYVIGVQYGKLKTKNDWLFKVTYTNLQRYSVVDFMAQNDWARWDYSGQGSPDGRLSNFNGAEFVTAYSVSEKINLVMKYYIVKQLISYGTEKETGQRIRFDLNVKI